MQSSFQAKAKCAGCGNENTVNTYPSINVSSDPDLKAKVKDGSLFVWECPHCGHINLAVFQTLYHDPEEKLMIWLLPEDNMDDGEKAALEKHMESLAGQITADNSGAMEGYTLRRVSDAGSLIEKVNIHDAGLDDATMEICKYVTKMELADKEQDKEKAGAIINADFKFYKMEGPDNDITLTYPSDGQICGVQIGFNVYEDCSGILKRNPASRPGAGFAKVDAKWLATVFR